MEGTRFSVRSTDEGFLDLVDRYLAGSRVDPGVDDDALRYSADCGVEKILPGGTLARSVRSLYLEGVRIFRGREAEEMAGSLVTSVRDAVTSWQDTFIRIRAGGVAVQGRGIVLPSSPEPHLPALVALLVRGGAAYLGDEIVRLDPVLRRVHGLSLPLPVDHTDIGLFRPSSPPRRTGRWREALTPRYPVALDELDGESAPPVPVGRVVFPYFEQGAETRLEPMEAAGALFRFVESCLNLHVWGDRAIELMRHLLESAPPSRLTVGSLREAASLLLRE